MARKTRKEMQAIKDKYGVKDIFSWSKYSTYIGDPYEYFLKYIIHKDADMDDNAYSYLGEVAHGTLEDYYSGSIKYNEMHNSWEDKLIEFHIMGLKYDRSDEKKNKKISIKYEACVDHFFQNHNITSAKKRINEKYMTTMIGKYLFQGYIDVLEQYKDGFIITDYKTSTIYVKKKIEKERMQLIIYAIGIHQNYNIPYNLLKIRWNFLKYITVLYLMKNGKIKERRLERHRIVELLSVQIISEMRTLNYSDIDIDNYLEIAKGSNDISLLPQDIQDRFSFDDHYVYIEINEEIAKNAINEINKSIDIISEKKEEYRRTKDERLFWQEVTKDHTYYLNNLGGYSPKLHKPWAEFINKGKKFDGGKNYNLDELEELYGDIFTDIIDGGEE